MGADRKPPGDTLEAGPTNEGLAPGWSVEGGEPKYDPAARVGGETDQDAKDDHDHDGEDEDEDERDARPAP